MGTHQPLLEAGMEAPLGSRRVNRPSGPCPPVPQLEVVVLCGGNARLLQRLEAKAEPRLHAEGFVPSSVSRHVTVM